MKSILLNICVFVLIFLINTYADAECPVAHTHIGVNPTWRPLDWSTPGDRAVDLDPTDNNKLWFFSVPPAHDCATPGWPNWEHVNGNTFLVLAPVTEEGLYITKPDDPNKTLYSCCFMYSKSDGYGDPNGLQHLNGWHSAHGPQGVWNLESIDANIVPAWDIYIQREYISDNLDEDDFFTLLHDDTPALEYNGDIYCLEKRWLSDYNAWGTHDHMGFYFWLDNEDEEVYIVLSAHDSGGLYQRSADFVMRFARTIYQPITGDLNSDYIVDVNDFEVIIEHWGESGIYSGQEYEEDGDHVHEH